MKVELHPTKCNLCGGKVEHIDNSMIYGRRFGSGFCYRCTECGAYVGTHRPRPKEALGLLADAQMRSMKMRCHTLFDAMWRTDGGRHRKRRNRLYAKLAEQMEIPVEECHFGYFDMEQLQKAYEILTSGRLEAE